MPEHPVVDEEGGGRTPFALSYFLHYHYHYRQPRTANFFFFFQIKLLLHLSSSTYLSVHDFRRAEARVHLDP